MKTICAIVVLMLSLISSAGQDQRAQLDTLRTEGYEALYNLDYQGARKRFQKMIEIAPDNPVGPQCYASSLWLEQLNQAWELKATLYSADVSAGEKPLVDHRQAEEFRKWTRRTRALS